MAGRTGEDLMTVKAAFRLAAAFALAVLIAPAR
jgi:hypothetical protein